MPEDESPKRLPPKMTRGGYRLQFIVWSIWTALQLVIVVMKLIFESIWDISDYLFVGSLILGVVVLGFLLYVRHHDGHFWEAEEATRDEWDRRGREL